MNVEQLSEKIAALVFFIAPHIINTAKHPFLFIETSFITCTELSHVVQVRAEGPKAPSPGQRPGLLRTQTCRPVRAKAFKYQTINKAFALTGRLVDCHYTQGVALG